MTNWSSMANKPGREWHLADSLIALGNEVNAKWPNRDDASDGALGDASHQARASDHNPDYSAGGVVRAIDIDKDGITVQALLNAVVRDPRVAYVIWDRRIASATEDGTPWNWEPYNGTNPHTGHVHISIKHTAYAADNTAPWFDAPPQEEDMPLTDADVKRVADAVWNRMLGESSASDAAQRARAAAIRLGTGGDLGKAIVGIKADVAAIKTKTDKLP